MQTDMDESRPMVRVISGGQTGVDQAALRAARDCGLEIGGWCSPGRVCESGAIPAEFPLRETPSDRSVEGPEVPRSQRTEWNVRDADATLILASQEIIAGDPGTGWTQACARRYQRPLLVVDPQSSTATDEIAAWVRQFSFRTLNVAGPSEGTCPGIGDRAYAVLQQIFTRLNHAT